MKEQIQKIIDSFDIKDTLNPAIFDLENNKIKMDVRKTLLDLADDFREDMAVKFTLEDVYLMGSNANYNWSEYSDVDLHLIVDFSSIKVEDAVLEEYFKDKKTLFNKEHQITIDIYPVEIYVQRVQDELPQNSGVYSVLNDMWVQEPVRENIVIDKDGLYKGIAEYSGQIKDILRGGGSNEEKSEAIDDLIYSIRKQGLHKDGEFSTANLAFKVFRRLGVQDLVKKAKTNAYDRKHSIAGSTNSFGSKVSAGGRGPHEKYADGIYYIIHGVKYSSLREAATATREKRSTIQYRVHSRNPKYSDYKLVYSKK